MVFSKDAIAGILLSSSKMNLKIGVDERMQIGYNVRLRLVIRGKNEFVLALRRSLLQYQINTTYKEKENTKRPMPVLYIGGIKNLEKTERLVPHLPDAKDEWGFFREAVEIISNKEHLTLKGLERLVEIKGELEYGTNNHE
jgi:hypothetical protein